MSRSTSLSLSHRPVEKLPYLQQLLRAATKGEVMMKRVVAGVQCDSKRAVPFAHDALNVFNDIKPHASLCLRQIAPAQSASFNTQNLQ